MRHRLRLFPLGMNLKHFELINAMLHINSGDSILKSQPGYLWYKVRSYFEEINKELMNI